MIAIVIPLYNKENQIANTLQTVFNQTFQDFEIVIVNDGSTDKSVEEVEKFNDARIRLIHQENAGVSAARNRGIKETKYDLIALLDADDEWKPEYLQEQINLINNFPECNVFACAYEYRDDKGKSRQITLNKMPFSSQTGVLTNYFEVASCSSPPFCSINIVARKECFLNIGGFPVGVKSGEDLLTWARLALKYKIAYNTIPCAVYLIESESKKGNPPVDLKITTDYVGVSLEKLYQQEANKNVKKDLALYISFWYKMRASINLDLTNRYPAIKCARKSLKYNPTNWKVYTFFVIALFPANFIRFIISKFRKL